MKGNGIFIIQDNGDLIEMTENQYDSEDILQELLAKYPSLLSGDQIDSKVPRKWILISREAGIPSEEGASNRWAVDHLFVDQDAIPTLVEVKRSTDTRIRREVVGQMLDYAANAVSYWSIEEIRLKFEQQCDLEGTANEQVLSDFLGNNDVEQFWGRLKTNLKAGKVRLIFVADKIPQELQRIVEFLNEQMDPAEVLAVEIKQYKGANLKTLVPRVIGQTTEAQINKRVKTTSNKWDYDSYLAELEINCGHNVSKTARKLLDWLKPRVTRIWWGEGGAWGSFVPVLKQNSVDYQIFAAKTTGKIEIYFYTLKKKKGFEEEEKREEIINRLNKIKGVSIPLSASSKGPVISFSDIIENEEFNKFIQALEWIIKEIESV
jgi:hypothetical protein